MYTVYHPNPWKLTSDTAPEFRAPTRPVEFRQPDYMQKYDSDTLWYDVFFENNGHDIQLICPPLVNLKSWFCNTTMEDESGRALEKSIRHRWRLDHVTLKSADASTLSRFRFSTSQFDHTITPGQNLAKAFRGRNCLLTKVKNDRLSWIRDWASFYCRFHGVNAVLIYNNGSTEYTSQELLDTLRNVDGLDVVVVVQWDFKFGPLGLKTGYWDSNFCEMAALEHARHLFLCNADFVISCDVDELMIDAAGKSVFEHCRASEGGHISVPGRWVYCMAPDIATNDLRHVDHRHVIKNQPLICPPKWVVMPQKIDPWFQWDVHTIYPVSGPMPNVEGVEFRHFSGINTGWMKNRRVLYHPSQSSVTEDSWLNVYYDAMGW